jgi:hypothetical protein
MKTFRMIDAKLSPWTTVALGLTFVTVFAQAEIRSAQNSNDFAETQTPPTKFKISYEKMPLSFEANHGQAEPQVKFISHGAGHTFFLTDNGEAVFVLRKSSALRDPYGQPLSSQRRQSDLRDLSVIKMKLVRATTVPRVDALDELPGKANYLIGNNPNKWNRNVPTFAKVKFSSVYPKVDLLYYGNQQQLEHDFVVAPGGDPKSIKIGFDNVDTLRLDAHGNLVVGVNDDKVLLQKPFIYQEDKNGRHEIPGGYTIKGPRQVAFHVAAYDPSKPLIIDPVLLYSTFLGNGEVRSVAVDSVNNVYVTGTTGSSDFPTTSGAFQTTAPGGGGDAFVTKLNAVGSLVYSTYLGGSGAEDAAGIALDANGSAYLTGLTCSSDFPTTPGAFQTTLKDANCDAYATKLNSTGSTLLYSTYLGGTGSDRGRAITVDDSGDAYVTGVTAASNFPVTPGAFQTTWGGGFDAFVTKLDPAGSALIYSTYLGGTDSDDVDAIALDSFGNAYVTGETFSRDFPITSGAFEAAFSATFNDGFVTKLDPSGSTLIYSTYLGGSAGNLGSDIAVDAEGEAFVAGVTSSADFPITARAFQKSMGGREDGFVTKLSVDGSSLVYSTYLGGSGDEIARGIAIDHSGSAYVTGETTSADFPLMNPIQESPAGGGDGFVTKLNPNGQALIYSTYLGGSGFERPLRIAVGSHRNAYVVGTTRSFDFPTTPGAFQPTYPGGKSDGFIVIIGADDQCSSSSGEEDDCE